MYIVFGTGEAHRVQIRTARLREQRCFFTTMQRHDALLAVLIHDPLNVEPSPTWTWSLRRGHGVSDVDNVPISRGEACPEKAVVDTRSCRDCSVGKFRRNAK